MELTKDLSSRRNTRIKVWRGIIVTPQGVGEVVNINRYGILFKCFKSHNFLGEWKIAIYDAMGLSLEQFPVVMVWEKRLVGFSAFSVEVGGEFKNLTFSQEDQLHFYLQKLAEMNNYY